MMRQIEFIAHSRALSFSLSSAFGGVAVLFIMDFVFSVEQSAITYAFVLVGSVIQYISTKRRCESNLTADADEVYLFRIPAALRYQKSITGRRYIRITSLTKKGYHRVKVFESWVSKQDWQFMLDRCT
ncbi:hypothetical protein [Vibrio ouci]|uniref:Uncharacterized protein n=1 Tax=Vibrio ouci TaxID=2499078 RepID=A0A4Y8WA97_9VIBR|nr:hypothetical protein [Vibrio ouci]TFH89211.1 hypothetical protein ELS82_23465 [Vibrio ouci]